MKNIPTPYFLESQGPILEGIVICGSMPGYEKSGVTYTQDDVLASISRSNKQLSERYKSLPSCLIRTEMLTGRSGDSNYKEEVFVCRFSASPRANPPIQHDELSDMLAVYATNMGTDLKQQRMYVQFDGQIFGLKVKSPS